MNKKLGIGIGIILLCVLGVKSVQAVVNIGPKVIRTGTEIKVLEPGPDLQALIDGITDAAVDKPYLIKLGPGEYTIEPDMTTFEGLKIAPFISIMGSGQGVTILKGAVSSGAADATSAIVSGASDASLTDLSVENTGGGSGSTGSGGSSGGSLPGGNSKNGSGGSTRGGGGFSPRPSWHAAA